MHGLRAQKSPGGLSHTSGASWVNRLTRQSTILARQRTACNRDGCPKTRPHPRRTRSRRNPFLPEQTRCASSCQILLMCVYGQGKNGNHHSTDDVRGVVDRPKHCPADCIRVSVKHRARHQSTTQAMIMSTGQSPRRRHNAPSRMSSIVSPIATVPSSGPELVAVTGREKGAIARPFPFGIRSRCRRRRQAGPRRRLWPSRRSWDWPCPP